ncbi:hypothetical protein HJO_11587 [Hyphomonas johnsonii MHS-2]|uniref:Porin domain-containing protein n=2 Tax=Hyphomonas johnsonii TaxID=81031 RepID=A0A059FMB9_9PROT|nr:hypothetical protein HJO_11587 [Hyphomonas johnsonii MHS-2]
MGLAGAHAVAQDDWDVWETEHEADIAVAASTADGAPVAWLGRFSLSTNRVLDNGLEIGAAGRFEVQADHPARAGFSGVPGGGTGVAGGWQGAFSGLALGPQSEHVGPHGQLEAAYIYAEGGYGEVRLGRDRGVAARFHEGAPGIFGAATTANPVLDPAGGGYIRTDHDLTGPAAKLSYASPRILGLRAGISFTPRADVRGLDRDPERSIPGVPDIRIESAAEAALNLNRRLRESGIRLQATLAYSRADVDAGAAAAPIYGTVETWSAGGSAEFDTVTVGASVLSSNNGVDSGPGDYSAWTIGATKQAFSLTFGLDYGESQDDLTGLDSEAWSIGASKEVRDGVNLALGYREQDNRQRQILPLRPASQRDSAEGVVLEITLSF